MEGIDLKKVMALMHSDTGGDEGRPDVVSEYQYEYGSS